MPALLYQPTPWRSPCQLAEEWRRLFELFNSMAREAAQYLANMIATLDQGNLTLKAATSQRNPLVVTFCLREEARQSRQ